jgi:hypothetical protein
MRVGIQLAGATWVAKINGRKHANGTRYGLTIEGEIVSASEDITIYDALERISLHLRSENADMELPDEIRLTLRTK